MAVGKKLRFEIFKRDKFTCQYCGRRPPDVMLEVDHIVPRCEGGTDAPENLTTSCAPCNRGKSGTPLENVAPAVDEDTLMSGLQEMLERQHSLKASTVAAEANRRAMDDAVGKVIEWWDDAFGYHTSNILILNEPSVRRFIADLGMEQVAEAIQATAAWAQRAQPHYFNDNKAFKYFCGVCWSMIRAQRDREADHA